MDKQIVISLKTVFLVLTAFVVGYVIYRLGPVIAIILMSLLLVISVEPGVKKIMSFTLFNKPIPRSVAVLIAYISLILVIIGVLTFGLPPVIIELQKLIISLAGITQNIGFLENAGLSVSDFLPGVSEVSSKILLATLSVFSNIAAFISLLIVSIYMSMDWENIKKRFLELFSRGTSLITGEIIDDVEKNIGFWIKGQLTLMLIIGLMSFVGLVSLNIKYPLALSIIAGFMEMIPMLGPLISAILAGIIGFADSPIKGMGVVTLFVVIQQLENNILVPKIMQRVSGFSPLVVLLAILIGGEFFGVVGVLTAVPVMMVISIILKKLLRQND